MSPVPVFLIALLLFTGCATQPEAKPRQTAQTPAIAATPVQTTKVVETRYEIRGYRDSTDPSIRHESHAVFRRTRVPLASPESKVLSRSENPPASIAPLPASEELAAELASQKKISSELRDLQAALTDAAEKMRSQYATLVRQSADALKLRDQLESERNRLKESSASAPVSSGATSGAVTSTEVKW